jgi:hypothetical protein
MWRQENHADKLREGRDELNDDEGEERPEAIPDRKVDRPERYRHCRTRPDSLPRARRAQLLILSCVINPS